VVIQKEELEWFMVRRIFGVALVAIMVLGGNAVAQAPSAKKPASSDRALKQWIGDLKAESPQVRNAAAYEIASMGPAGAKAVPALIEALDDSEASVRFPATVALGEIGPAAKAAVPRLKEMVEQEINDEVAAGARRALKRIDPAAVATE
jgi:HEAT repeat protein